MICIVDRRSAHHDNPPAPPRVNVQDQFQLQNSLEILQLQQLTHHALVSCTDRTVLTVWLQGDLWFLANRSLVLIVTFFKTRWLWYRLFLLQTTCKLFGIEKEEPHSATCEGFSYLKSVYSSLSEISPVCLVLCLVLLRCDNARSLWVKTCNSR